MAADQHQHNFQAEIFLPSTAAMAGKSLGKTVTADMEDRFRTLL